MREIGESLRRAQTGRLPCCYPSELRYAAWGSWYRRRPPIETAIHAIAQRLETGHLPTATPTSRCIPLKNY